MNKVFSSSPIWQQQGLGLIRIITGFFMIYHGYEVFDSETMNGYLTWEMFKDRPSGKFLIYTGKIAELIAGILLFIGLFTRLSAIVIALTMLSISLFVGKGRIWYEDQHPFLFVLLALVFVFAGPGSWSIDNLLDREKNDTPS